MAQGTSYIGDIRSAVTAKGEVSNLDSVALATSLGVGNYVTPSADFTIEYNGVIIEGTKNVPIPTDAATKIFLLANAPVA